MHRDEVTLLDIVRAARLVSTFIAGMRDHLIHAYDAVDWDEVWKTASRDVPGLLARLGPLLTDRFPPEGGTTNLSEQR